MPVVGIVVAVGCGLPATAQTPTPAAPPAAGAGPVSYLPRPGADDPALRAEMARLLAARGLPRPVRLILVEPEWQTERLPDRGLIARRTRNAAVVYRDPAAPKRLLLRYALFAADWNGRGRGGRYGAVYLRDAGKPRPFVGRL